MQPNQPSITPAAIGATIVALIAPAADLLATFGVYTLTAAQQGAVTKMIYALAAVAAVIIAADAHLRAARNKARAQIESAKPTPPLLPSVQVGSSGTNWTSAPPFQPTSTEVQRPTPPVKPAAVKPRSHKKKV